METEFQSDVLEKALGRVIHAAGDGERPILATVLFEGDDKGFRLVTADNYRIAIAELSTEDHTDFGRVAVSTDYIGTLRAFLKIWKRTVALAVNESRLMVRDDYGAVECRIVDGTFPPYQKVIPLDGPIFGVNPAYLIDAAKAAKGAKASVLKVRKGDQTAVPFVIESDGYREAIMPILVEPDGSVI